MQTLVKRGFVMKSLVQAAHEFGESYQDCSITHFELKLAEFLVRIEQRVKRHSSDAKETMASIEQYARLGHQKGAQCPQF
jgi:hypothetical protein